MSLRVIVPVLTLTDANGRPDYAACASYAQYARQTWLDYFMVSGSIGGGAKWSAAERRRLLETWATHVPTERLLACVWTPEELCHAKECNTRPVAVLRGFATEAALLTFLGQIPAGTFVYSHPQYTAATLTAAVAALARENGVLPAGGKLSKISIDEVRRIRKVVGEDFELYDGRCRHITRSVSAGANGVAAVPLSVLPPDLPAREDVEGLQRTIDRVQALLDQQPNQQVQTDMLATMLRENAL